MLAAPVGNLADLANTGFLHLSAEHGLSQRTVQSIYQDREGLLWFGTQEGLNLYDGRKIQIFRHSDRNEGALPHDFIKDIGEDAQGNLWIATLGGLSRFNRETNRFETIALTSQSGEPVVRVACLYLAPSGELWVGSDGAGLFRLDYAAGERKIQQFSLFKEINQQDIRAILQDSRGRLWVGTDNSGIILLDASKTQSHHFTSQVDLPGSIASNRVRSIIEDSKGQIWVATRGGGVARFDELSRSFRTYRHDPADPSSLSHDRVYTLFEDTNQLIWIGTDAGVSVYSETTDQFIRVNHQPSQKSSLSHNRVLAIYQDQGGLIWLGSSSGLNQWNPVATRFVHYRQANESGMGLSHNHVHGFAESQQGGIYIATFGGGLNYFDPRSNRFTQIALDPANTHITTLMRDGQNRLWVGSYAKGVSLLASDHGVEKNFNFVADDPASLSDNGVTDILQDRDGDYWISTYRAGLNRLSKAALNQSRPEFSHYRKGQQGLLNDNIFQLLEDDEGYIWLATDGGGLFRLDKHSGQFAHISHQPGVDGSLSGNTVWSMFQDSKGRLWVGTQGNGLNRWEPQDRRNLNANFKHYNIEQGLNGSTVNGIVEDQDGSIWISTNQGLSQLDPETDKLVTYNLAEGIHSNEFNQGAVLEAKDGRLYFGGLEGVTAFYPNEIGQNQHKPKVVLTKITSQGKELTFNKPLTQLQQVNFDHTDYLIRFEFAALDYALPGKNQYQYKLEGLDAEWVMLGNLNRATFTNLPGGNYVLRVRGSNNDGLWSEEAVNLKINVMPAPWSSWWAFSLYASVFCGLLLLVVRLQAKRLANKEVFNDSVNERVQEKTLVYVKINEYLREQLELVKYQANVDMDTGLPNQNYLYDLVKANLYWINQNRHQSSHHKIVLALVKLPELEKSPSLDANAVLTQTIREFSRQFSGEGSDFRLVVRWSRLELGVICYVANREGALSLVREVRSALDQQLRRQLGEEKPFAPLRVGFSLLPLSGVNQSGLDGESLLMLTEHIARLVCGHPQFSVVGVLGVHQVLGESKFKQIMAVDQLDQLYDLFELEKY